MPDFNPFDHCAEQYRIYRPDYPADLIETICKAAGGLVLDVGAGTGKASVPLLERSVPTICVEPSLPMIRQGIAYYPGLHYVCSTAEALPIATASAAVVFSAQAFHWFDAPRALREFARVLQSGGWIFIFWNTRDSAAPAAAIFESLVQKWNPQRVLGHRRDDYRGVIDETGLFNNVERRAFRWSRPMTIESWVGLAHSISYIHEVGPEKLAHFDRDLRNELSKLDVLDCPYIIDFWSARVLR